MRQSLPARLARVALSAGLAFGALAPSGLPAAAADPVVLRVGTVQDLDSLNPYATALVVGYEVYQLSYDLLVQFGPDIEPYPGFADKWERAADGHSWTFHIREGMKWSDGQPATAQDACFSFQMNLDAVKAEESIGLGYIDPNIKDAGVTKVECPDDQTMILTTDDPSTRILQTYVPILPKHIWGKETYKTMGEAKFDGPLVGTGPYTEVEWKTGQYARFERNQSYWGKQGFADQVIIQFYKTVDTMVQAFKAGELDYIRNPNNQQFDALKGLPNVATVVGVSNGWTELGFNSYGTGTGKTIKGGGPSTKALLDPAFRDALGYAIDKQLLLDRVLGGYGTLGTSIVPPVLGQWYTAPDDVRTFSIDTAKQKLDAAGYLLNANGQRLDKDGKPISLSLVMPDSDADYPKEGQFIADWFGQLGIKVTPKTHDSASLTDLMLPPEAGGAANKADYDLFIWGWSGSPDPNTLLQIFKCDAIGNSSDSNWCDKHYDELYDQQNIAQSNDARKTILAEMQQYWYDQAPYHILFYDSELHAYRTDRFAGWQNMPRENGTPLFAYGTLDYTLLTDATAVASPTPAASGSGAPSTGPTAAPSASPSPGGEAGAGGTPTLLIGLIVVVVVLVAAGLFFGSRRRRAAESEEE
jgi:peptide/nickel transport system substrate-binding protein